MANQRISILGIVYWSIHKTLFDEIKYALSFKNLPHSFQAKTIKVRYESTQNGINSLFPFSLLNLAWKIFGILFCLYRVCSGLVTIFISRLQSILVIRSYKDWQAQASGLFDNQAVRPQGLKNSLISSVVSDRKFVILLLF